MLSASTSVDPTNHLVCSTVVLNTEKYSCMSGHLRFKIALFKGQLYLELILQHQYWCFFPSTQLLDIVAHLPAWPHLSIAVPDKSHDKVMQLLPLPQ